MALRGTLKDFGIADIFQLIGHQSKTGRLVVRNRDEHADILFFEGNVVRATPGSREKKDLLGNLLVRAEVITEAELQNALETQQNTLKRLGDLLIETTSVDREALQTFAKLQTTETLYRLFLWNAGSYEFESADVPPPEEGELIRSESVLMESFRQVDEWPAIRKKISGYGMTFAKLEDLDELVAQEAAQSGGDDDDMFGDLDDAFGEFDGGGGSSSGRLRNIGDNERLTFALITPERDVQKIIDLSRLGEFETCKALCNLIDGQIIEALQEAEKKAPSADATVGGITISSSTSVRVAIRAAVVIAAFVGAFLVASYLGLEASSVVSGMRQGYMDTAVQETLSRAHLQRLDEALAVFRAQNGTFPAGLTDLVEEGLIETDDLSFPWHQEYYYAQRGDGFVLLRPLY